MKIKIINRCPKCQSERINYVIDIFKKPTSKKYYTGKCECVECKHKFDRKQIIQKEWVTVEDMIELIAMSKPSHVETIMFDMIGRKHFDKLSDNMRKRYLSRAELFVNKLLEKTGVQHKK